MPAVAPDKRHTWLARQIGTLAIAHVQSLNPMAPVRASAWHNALARIGVPLPLFVISDVGLLLTAPPSTRTLGPRPGVLDKINMTGEARQLLARYQSLLESIAESEVVEKAPTFRLRDEVIAVLLGRIFGDLYNRFGDPAKRVGVEALPLDPTLYAEASSDEIARHFAQFDAQPLLSFVRFLVENRLQILTSIEQIDLDTLRLLGIFGGPGSGQSPVDLVDLYGVFQSAEANDVVDFSLDLLPSVLETKRAAGVQTFAVDGYASIERKGSPDSLLLTEFAWDAELFERKVVDDELYYYGRERQREEKRRLQYILVDSSPSMRGVRQVFARGLALALGKKLLLQGDEVWLRFFDSRLYDTQRLKDADSAVPYLLCFKSERGRNYGKVFRQLQLELSKLKRDESRQVVVYIITHGQCHLPSELVEQLARDAFLYGIIILPSSEVKLEYLPLLQRHQIVDDSALASREGRKSRALDIISDAGADAGAKTVAATSTRKTA
jgi:hypothetical protein